MADVAVPGIAGSLLQAFQHGDIGVLHFSCHAFARGTPNASRILLGNQPFEQVFLREHAGRFGAPPVVLNACQTDERAPVFTTVEGWAASFLRAGGDAFIGSLWDVANVSARTYAQEFYRAALGATLGSRRARPATPSAAIPVSRPCSPAPCTTTWQQP
jgi:CHAT domain-containing protein